MKISSTVEQIFAHAVALDQSGGLRNTIYAIENHIYILNYDHTLLLRFLLRRTEAPFQHPISFRANDYDSNLFHEEDGKIVFVVESDGFERRKSCGTPDFTPDQIKKVFKDNLGYPGEWAEVFLPKNMLSLLDRDLSHIEFTGEKGSPIKLTQRNIYSGGIVEIQKKGKGLFQEDLPFDIEPVAIKTNDFLALYSFQEGVRFLFPPKGEGNIVQVKGMDDMKRHMTGLVACCIYDEIIEVKEAGKSGREEPKKRRSEQETDRPTEGRTGRERPEKPLMRRQK